MSSYLDSSFATAFATNATLTGQGAVAQNRSIVMAFDQYEIVLAVTEDNRVLGVIEVRQKKDFRNLKQRIASTGYFDMERFAE